MTGGEPAGADWPKLAQAGWPGLEVPAAQGGSGASFAEVAVVLEELGRAATATPFLGTVLAVGALGLVEPSPARDELLAGIAAGDVVATVAVPTGAVDLDAGRLPFRLEHVDGGLRLVGRVPFVPDAPGADRILVVADDPTVRPRARRGRARRRRRGAGHARGRRNPVVRRGRRRRHARPRRPVLAAHR